MKPDNKDDFGERNTESRTPPNATEDNYEIRVRYRTLTDHICQCCGKRIEHFAVGDNFNVSVFESTEECSDCIRSEAMSHLGL